MRRVRRKPRKPKQIFQCTICKDVGFIVIDNQNSKCQCTIKRELDIWLDDVAKVALRGKPLNLDLSRSSPDFLLFKNHRMKTFTKTVAKELVTNYFRNGTKTFSYFIITGDQYTSEYVEGNHHKYHKAKELYLILGIDNKNVSLQTTLFGLLMQRQAKGLRTWVLVVKGTESNLDFLYGKPLVEYLQDKENFNKVIEG